MNKWIVIPALAGAVVLGSIAMVVNADQRKMNTPIEKNIYTNHEVAGVTSEDKVEVEANQEIPAYDIENEVRPDAMIYEGLAEPKEENKGSKKQEKYKKDKSHKKSMRYENIMSVEEAITIANKSVQGNVTEFELDEDNGRYIYEIEIHDGVYEYELEIDAITGEILDFEKDLD